MWTFITGYILSNIFENQTVLLFKNKFYTSQLSLIGMIVGWLFQEHQREEKSNLTAGKRFMLEREYRNRFLTQIFKIVKNIIFYPYLVTSLELGTFLWIFGLIFLSLVKRYLPDIKKYTKDILTQIFNKNTYNIDHIVPKIYTFIYNNWNINTIYLFITFIVIFKTGFLKIYFWFDIIYILKPIFLFMLFLFILFCIFWVNYLIYTTIIYNCSKNLALMFNILSKKCLIYFSILCIILELIFFDINLQNLNTENFFKEILFKLLFFIH